MPDPYEQLTRRSLLRRAGLGAAALSGASAMPASADAAAERRADDASLGARPAGLPERQFAWTTTLTLDTYGNPIAPQFDRLLFFDVRDGNTSTSARVLEAALRSLERTYPWGPEGLLFTVGWGPRYFEHVLGVKSPVPRPEVLSTFEEPVLDDYDMCLHLACDDEQRLAAVEAALVSGAPLGGAGGALRLSGALRWRETRTGFVGAGLPARHQDVTGIPPGNPVSTDSPLFMGFKSGLVKNQASEDAVSIPDGAFADGTTMHISYMHLNLQFWYDRNTELQRVREMYAAQVAPTDVPEITTSSPNHANELEQAILDYGVVGHAQTSARARRNGKPIILRRDFNTVDGGHAGLHFVALQRTIDDFVKTRRAMNASGAEFQNPVITNTANNGINAYMLVHRRANYILPPRRNRSFPGV